jgi:DNA-binding transcriptional ArsR family regulator
MPTKQTHAAGVNAQMFRVLAHPLRYRILSILTEREASPSQLAIELEEPLDTISYHVREMEKASVIEFVRRVPGRRGEQKMYKSIARPVIEIGEWERVIRPLREVNSAWNAELIVSDMVRSIEAGVFDARTGRTMVRVPGVVDEDGWEELEPLAEAWLEGIFDIFAKSADRLAKKGGSGFNVVAAILAHEAPPPEADLP